MNYYRDYRCELTFDSVTGQLTIKSDREVQPFVNEILGRERVLNASFTNYSNVKDIKYTDTYATIPTRALFKEFPLSITPPPPMFSPRDEDMVKPEYYSSDSEYTATCESILSDDIDPSFQSLSPYAEASTAGMVAKPPPEVREDSAPYMPVSSMGSYYTLRSLLSELQQLECKALVKLLIRIAIPAKKANHPYKDGEKSRPKVWPAGVPHRQPDHMSKEDRLNLLHHFLTKMSFEDVLIVCHQFGNSLTKRKQLVLHKILSFLAQQS